MPFLGYTLFSDTPGKKKTTHFLGSYIPLYHPKSKKMVETMKSQPTEPHGSVRYPPIHMACWKKLSIDIMTLNTGWWLSLPLWKIWPRQLGSWNSQLNGKIKAMFQTTNRNILRFYMIFSALNLHLVRRVHDPQWILMIEISPWYNFHDLKDISTQKPHILMVEIATKTRPKRQTM
jgi:hypothetical protein